jgi:hypothetical protein
MQRIPSRHFSVYTRASATQLGTTIRHVGIAGSNPLGRICVDACLTLIQAARFTLRFPHFVSGTMAASRSAPATYGTRLPVTSKMTWAVGPRVGAAWVAERAPPAPSSTVTPLARSSLVGK